MKARLNRWLNWFRARAGIPSNTLVDGTIPAESVAPTPVRACEASLLRSAGELGAECGTLQSALDPAIERLHADLNAAAHEHFKGEDAEVLEAQEQAIVTHLAAIRAAAASPSAPAFVSGDPCPEPLVTRRTRLSLAAASAVACLGVALQAAGLIGWMGWAVLIAGTLFSMSVAPEAGIAIRVLGQTLGTWRRGRRIRIATAAAEARWRAIQERKAERLATLRRRESWLELTARRVLAELRLQQDRGVHARDVANLSLRKDWMS